MKRLHEVGDDEPVSIHHHAADNLRFIRATLEQAGSFTAVPGIGGVVMGLTALLASVVASMQPTPHGWFMVWVAEAVIAFLIGSVAMLYKARGSGAVLYSVPGRRFAVALFPGLIAGGLLTMVLYREQRFDLLPGTWLLLYGAASAAGGALSVRAIPVMGFSFIALGGLAFVTPASWGNGLLAAGFGAAHIITGIIIARNHGG